MASKKDILTRHYFIAFFSTLVVSMGLLITSFIMPPKNEITPSTLKGAALTFLWPALAFGAKAVEYKFGHDDEEKKEEE